ncbi:MAG TPA: DUF2795 domain-containing protein [Nitrososphaeraceae archaeon]|nr:DUF2795 domain-containing protein [Nitrososphaeraceae archaeon]
MVKEDNSDKESQIIEHGDIFFFYRPKVGTEEVEDIGDVQRFYMITSSDDGYSGRAGKRKETIYRLFLIGQKQLPEIIEGKSTSKERNWALNTLTTSNPDDIHKELAAAEYTTETRGKRRIAAAIPAGEGKYSIVKHAGHTELAYLLELPEEPGPTQKEFEIRKEASYIVSVKNPNISVPGFAAFSSRKKPEYPGHLIKKFGDRRWISIDDPELLNYENIQLLLIGARKKDVEEELGIDIDEQNETENSADIFKDLKIKKEQIPLKPLLKGRFPEAEEIPMAQEVKQLSPEEAPGVIGGKIGGKAAITRGYSAAAITKVLSGIEFPKDKNKVIDYAEKNKTELDEAEQVINTLKEIPDKTYHNMAEVEKALGTIR